MQLNPKKKFYETAAETLIKNLDKRGMEAYYVDNGEDALKMALRFVTPGSVFPGAVRCPSMKSD